MRDADVGGSRASQNDAPFAEIDDDLRAEKVDGVIAIDDLSASASRGAVATTFCPTLSENEAVREAPARFAVRPGHVHPGFDRAVEEHDGYTVVEKRSASGDS
jgi:hypothetical protein